MSAPNIPMGTILTPVGEPEVIDPLYQLLTCESFSKIDAVDLSRLLSEQDYLYLPGSDVEGIAGRTQSPIEILQYDLGIDADKFVDMCLDPKDVILFIHPESDLALNGLPSTDLEAFLRFVRSDAHLNDPCWVVYLSKAEPIVKTTLAVASRLETLDTVARLQKSPSFGR